MNFQLELKIMDALPKTKQKHLIKILIGVAWLDGRIQLEEHRYLQQLAETQGLANDSELKPWLYQLRTVTATECYDWIQDYLGPQPTAETCYQLLEAISGLIYSDGEVAIEEAKLVNRLAQMQLAQSTSKPSGQIVLSAVQKLYRRWVDRTQSTMP